MYLMMDIEISCKGHCESFSHFLYLVSYSVLFLFALSLEILCEILFLLAQLLLRICKKNWQHLRVLSQRP